MIRYMTLALFASVSLVSVVVATATGTSYGEEADIKAAVDAYHTALGTLDISKMEPLWAHDPNVMLVNPRDTSITVGWDAVKNNWETAWTNYSSLKVTQLDGPHVVVKGDVAWSTGIANAVLTLKTGNTITAPTFETDVFEKRGSQWLLVSHIASRVPQ